MSNRRKPLTLDEHRQLGLTLAVMRDELVSIDVWLSNEHLPKSHPAVRRLEAAVKRIDAARSDLEEFMYDHHDDERGVNTWVYYPDPADRKARSARPPGDSADRVKTQLS
jgi:hypothetical protein